MLKHVCFLMEKSMDLNYKLIGQRVKSARTKSNKTQDIIRYYG